jgi:hypothetical protein
MGSGYQRSAAPSSPPDTEEHDYKQRCVRGWGQCLLLSEVVETPAEVRKPQLVQKEEPRDQDYEQRTGTVYEPLVDLASHASGNGQDSTKFRTVLPLALRMV